MKIISLMFFIFCITAQAETATRGYDPALKCIPSSFTLNDRVTIKLPKNHPKGWSIKTPTGKWIAIQDLPKIHGEDPKQIFSLFEPKTFGQMTVIKFNPIQLKGSMRDKNGTVILEGQTGEPRMFRVFEMPGEYLLYFTDGLEDESGHNFFMELEINFKSAEWSNKKTIIFTAAKIGAYDLDADMFDSIDQITNFAIQNKISIKQDQKGYKSCYIFLDGEKTKKIDGVETGPNLLMDCKKFFGIKK